MKYMFIILIGLSNSCTLKKSIHSDAECSTCTGSNYCGACKNCKYCKYCSVNGGSCGVCK